MSEMKHLTLKPRVAGRCVGPRVEHRKQGPGVKLLFAQLSGTVDQEWRSYRS